MQKLIEILVYIIYDFITVRQDERLGYVTDILELPGANFKDNFGKVKDFAEYARQNPAFSRG